MEEKPAGDPMSGSTFATEWTRIRVRGVGESTVERAYGFFARQYRQVVYDFYRRSGRNHNDAEDLTQALFLDLLVRGFLASADPTRGKFRTFLRAAAKNFAVDSDRARGRQKRRPAEGLRSLDLKVGESERTLDPASDDLSPEEAFDRKWAHALVEAACSRLEDHYRSVDRAADALVFRMKFFENLAPPEIAERSARPIQEVYKATHRAKADFARFLREEVAATVGPREVEDELRYLREIFES